MRANNTLGIIVNSNRYFSFVTSLADAALSNGKTVKIHLLGQGWEYIMTDAYQRLRHLARITLCALSAGRIEPQDAHRFQNRIEMIPPQELSTILAGCNRYVVF